MVIKPKKINKLPIAFNYSIFFSTFYLDIAVCQTLKSYLDKKKTFNILFILYLDYQN